MLDVQIQFIGLSCNRRICGSDKQIVLYSQKDKKR